MRANSLEAQAFIETEEARVANLPVVIPVNGQSHPAEPEHPLYLPPRESAWLRLAAWIASAIGAPQPIQRLATWPLRMILRGVGTRMKPGPLRIWLGGAVDSQTRTRRNIHCAQCSTAYGRMEDGKPGALYCGSCGCPEWFGSQLKRKNGFALWYCPRRKHEGPYPETELHDSAPEDLRRFVVLSLPVAGGKKTACGQRG